MAQYKQCPQGHYFDPAIYNTCPYCTDVNRRSSGGLESQVTVPVNYQNDIPRSNNTAPASDNGPVSAAEAENSGTSDPVSGTANTIGGITVPAPVIKTKSKEGEDPNPEDDTKFVVGWLVAVEGPYRGRSFELYNGYCSIGREQGDIILNKDKQVSREKNLSTVYDSDNNCFYITAGESRNVAHFNGKALLSGSSKEMNAYDVIKVGTTKFIFVPFCCDKFSWNTVE